MHPPPSPTRANFTLMTECTPEAAVATLCTLCYKACLYLRVQFSLKQDASTEYILSKNRGEKGYVGGPKCFDENPPLPGQHCLTGIAVTVHFAEWKQCPFFSCLQTFRFSLLFCYIFHKRIFFHVFFPEHHGKFQFLSLFS